MDAGATAFARIVLRPRPLPRPLASREAEGGAGLLPLGMATAGRMSQAGPMVVEATPPGGATVALAPCGEMGEVSIHAPTRGATLAKNAAPLLAKFRSTPPRGGRPLPSNTLTDRS